jgi:hypothetical protein
MLVDVLDAMPAWHTLQSLVRVESGFGSQRELKDAFEAAVTAACVPASQSSAFELGSLPEVAFADLEFIHYEQTQALRGPGNRRTHTGGLKVRLLDTQGRPHFVWFRVSKTESGVARFVADSPDPGIAGGLHTLAQGWYQKAATSA